MKYYIDAGTTYSKIIEIKNGENIENKVLSKFLLKSFDEKNYYIIPSKNLRNFNLHFEKSCGHMNEGQNHENEIIALAKGCEQYLKESNATVLDMGSRDIKWIRFKNKKFKDMDWNTSCASSTGATVEMLLKFYDIDISDLRFCEEKFPVTCGIFGLEKIMDDISKGIEANLSVSKFIHGIAYNAWNFCKKPKKIYLSGGFCDNKCFVESLEHYCNVELLGRFVLCEGLSDD